MKPEFFASTHRVSDLPPPTKYRYRPVARRPDSTYYRVRPNDHKPRRIKLDERFS